MPCKVFGIDIEFLLVIMVGYKGWTTHGKTKDPAAKFSDPILHVYGINF
jgi:hypothetical protein|tara:strand:+ start:382 stop:528 length:147 start_codon:yes stop_codon:yes gene_type:complete